MTLAGRTSNSSAVPRPCHDACEEQPCSQLITSSLSESFRRKLAHFRSTIFEGPEMENYCTACGKWRRLVAFWHCRDCLDHFYAKNRRDVSRAALVDRNDSVR